MAQSIFKTPIGMVFIEGDNDGITKISVSDEDLKPSAEVPAELQKAVSQLKAYFSGNICDFQLDLNLKGTEFQQKVWQEIQKVPYGKTISYLDLARKLDNPKVIRAAASATGKNPLWIVVPCHRIVGSDGSLTGYAGGLWRKKWLLEHENPEKQQSLF